MKKAALLLIAAFALVMLIGCSTIKEIEVPSSYEFTPGLTSGREYVVLGQVSLDSNAKSIIGIQLKEGKRFSEFLALTKALYPDCDAIINCYVDEEAHSAFIVESSSQIIRGTAIKYK